MAPEPPALPAVLLKPWPVIVVITTGWLIAVVLAFTVPGLHEWRPFTIAGLAVGALGTSIIAVATPRRAPRIARSPERAQLNSNEENTMAAPLLQAQIDINAPVGKVWSWCPISAACRSGALSAE